MKNNLLLPLLMIALVAFSGCVDSDDDDNDGDEEEQEIHNRSIYVDFKANTNVSYSSYLEEKYNITESSSSIDKNGYIDSCTYSVPENVKSSEIMEQMRGEEAVDYVTYANLTG